MKTLKQLFTICFCIMTLHASAQFSIGFRSGYTESWEEYGDVDLPDDADIKVEGYQVSLLAYLQLNKNFSVGVEPGFVKRGAACIPGFGIFQGDTKLLLDYVELPLLCKAKYPVFNNRIDLFAKLGYGASMITTAYSEETLIGTETPIVNKTKLDLSDDNSLIKKWDHGVYSGIGVGINFGRHQILFETSFYHGMIDVERLNTSKNRSVHCGLGYMINL